MSIRLAEERDLEVIRRWRNDHRESFFTRHTITEKEHLKWFKSRGGTEEDFLFMVLSSIWKIGCIGIRKAEGIWELYNVIRGTGTNNGEMGEALKSVIDYARTIESLKVQARVVKGLLAIKWYKKNGFEIKERFLDFIVMEYKG